MNIQWEIQWETSVGYSAMRQSKIYVLLFHTLDGQEVVRKFTIVSRCLQTLCTLHLSVKHD